MFSDVWPSASGARDMAKPCHWKQHYLADEAPVSDVGNGSRERILMQLQVSNLTAGRTRIGRG